jgi:hypothetical protein
VRKKKTLKIRIEAAQLDKAARTVGTVTVTKKLFSVRPLRSRKEYVLPLVDVAEIVVARVSKVDAMAARLARAR